MMLPWTRVSLRMLLAAALIALVPLTASARTAAPLAADPVLEQRLMTLAADLRCLVCQNQSLAESNAELAVDLRGEMREQMRHGASDQDVIDYLVERYGDFVLYRPPLKASTLLLWFGPAMLLLLGLGLLIRTLARRRVQAVQAPLSAAARARARELLGADSAEEAS
ncbi:MAG TPA: cytochrome c-type biogenesis protein [Burkholderiales bacterium]|nr:cytochrome c-type biogenesis protein [Burkholderiales bacterium]